MAIVNQSKATATNNNNSAPQAYLNNLNGDQRGFFSLSNRIKEDLFNEVLEYLNVPEVQKSLEAIPGENKNHKKYFTIKNAKGIIGFLQGASDSTIVNLTEGNLIFSNTKQIENISEIF